MVVEIYAAKNEIQAAMLLSLLDQVGIEGQIVGEFLNGVAGEIPIGITAAPRIWVNESDAEKARKVIAEWEKAQQQTSEAEPANPTPGWTCPNCETDIEVDFNVCWNCLYNPLAC